MVFVYVEESIKSTQNFKSDIIAQEVNEISSFQRQHFQNANNNSTSFYRSSLTTIVTFPNNSEERST